MAPSTSGVIRPHSSSLSVFHRISDAVIIFLTLYLSVMFYGIDWQVSYLNAAFISVLLFYFIGEGLGLYVSWRGVPAINHIKPVITSWIITVFILLIIGYAIKTTSSYSRVAFGFWVILAPLFVISWRLLVREVLGSLRAKGFNSRSVAIVGANEQGDRLADFIDTHPETGMRLNGVYDDRKILENRVHKGLSLRINGDNKELLSKARAGKYDIIYIALPMKAARRIQELVSDLSDTTVSVYIMPDFFIFDLLHARWTNLGDISTVSIYESPHSGINGWVKRTEDIILALLILLIIVIPMFFIALGVKLSSPGPVLFKQTRYGLDGCKIKVWKFRSMSVTEDGDTIKQAQKGDSRITKFGRILRKTSLDELPQFINVLLGEMSIVGPRPHAVAHNEEFRNLIPGYMLRHKVKPGITGWAQINGWRGETNTVDKMRYRIENDLWYIRNWSVWLDLKIIVLTIRRGFIDDNAY